jgi:peptidoglycan/LPS O-acetylase OafA/YrhL
MTQSSPHGGAGTELFLKTAHGGWVGVQLFFVVSGFLITGILLDAKPRPYFFSNFYVRRTLRIFPPYYATLAVLLWVLPHVLGIPAEVRPVMDKQGWLWSYTSNIALLVYGGWSFGGGWLHLDHMWSLAVEEQFYLVWPLVVFLVDTRWLTRISIATVVLSPFLRLAMFKSGLSPEGIYAFTPCRLDALAMGALLAIFVRHPASEIHTSRLLRILLATGCVGLIPVIALSRGLRLDSGFVQFAGFSALGLLFSGVVLAAYVATPESRVGRFLSSAPMVFLGRYSYGIYLFHLPLRPAVTAILPIDRLVAMTGSVPIADLIYSALDLAMATALAYVSWHVLEKHFLALKDRFTRSGGGALRSAA